MERMSDSADKPIDNDAEGVWSPDIEQSFQEALAIYPPCGRRKIILSDEGKMYGRNELIARYIKLRTGKTRTRKQVSSHIQVLARKKVREIQAAIKVTSMDQTAKDKALQHMAAMSSAQIVSATAIHNKLGLPGIPRPTFPGAPGFWPGMIQTGQPGSSQDVKPFVQQAYPIQPAVTAPIPGFEPASAPAPSVPAWQGRSIGTTKLRLVEFSAFLEPQRDPDSYNKHLFVHIGHANHSYSDPLLESVDIRQIYDKFPEKKGGLKELFGKGPQNAFFLVKFWADLNCNIQDDAGAFYCVTSQYESSENMTVTCSTKVCSFGKQVVEKVETEYARFENGRFVYRINRSPMCEYMINFIHKLKHLPEKYMMNSVLENFTILLLLLLPLKPYCKEERSSDSNPMTAVFGELSFVPSHFISSMYMDCIQEPPRGLSASKERPPVILVSKEDRADMFRSPWKCGTEIANANACRGGAATTNKRGESAVTGRTRH
ncbi:transcriptional enhancer factor TEF-1 isoform X3 [Myotis myotis]|uniref:transcriptional enhancer factor TEF-1 isoform X3 n=1 Tax=Myotis myotis TaxID=51298 RepID=UPI00174D66CF|nr:transcriptional enhancer factor TEF-1 isoform X3 [Myotis myotis]